MNDEKLGFAPIDSPYWKEQVERSAQRSGIGMQGKSINCSINCDDYLVDSWKVDFRNNKEENMDLMLKNAENTDSLEDAYIIIAYTKGCHVPNIFCPSEIDERKRGSAGNFHGPQMKNITDYNSAIKWIKVNLCMNYEKIYVTKLIDFIKPNLASQLKS